MTLHDGGPMAGMHARQWLLRLLLIGVPCLAIRGSAKRGNGTSHFVNSWPYLLLLACALMHLFHGHGGRGRHAGRGPQPGQE
jgi:Protein of unknown function (DUF2933)